MMSLQVLLKCIVLEPALRKCPSVVIFFRDVIEDPKRITRTF